MTLGQEFLMLIPVGRPEDIQRALWRREQRELKNKEINVANLLEKPYREATGGSAFP